MKKSIGINQYSVGVNIGCCNYIFAEQNLTNWCWAASTQMVLKSHCIDFHQSQIVEILTEGESCYPYCKNNFLNIANFLNNKSVRTTDGTKIIKAQAKPGLPNADFVIGQLEMENPIMIGLREPQLRTGHAVVLINVEYEILNNFKHIYKLSVLDPSPHPMNILNKGMREYNGSYISKVLSDYFWIDILHVNN